MNDALVDSQTKLRETAAQNTRIAALRNFARRSRLRFDNGVASYLGALIAENDLFAA